MGRKTGQCQFHPIAMLSPHSPRALQGPPHMAPSAPCIGWPLIAFLVKKKKVHGWLDLETREARAWHARPGRGATTVSASPRALQGPLRVSFEGAQLALSLNECRVGATPGPPCLTSATSRSDWPASVAFFVARLRRRIFYFRFLHRFGPPASVFSRKVPPPYPPLKKFRPDPARAPPQTLHVSAGMSRAPYPAAYTWSLSHGEYGGGVVPVG